LGGEGYSAGEILHGGILCGRNSSWENFLWEKFFIGEFSAKETFCWEGGISKKNFPLWGFFGMIRK